MGRQQILVYVFARKQQSEKEAGLGGCCHLVSFGLCADVSLYRIHDAPEMGTNDVQGGFDPLVQTFLHITTLYSRRLTSIGLIGVFLCSFQTSHLGQLWVSMPPCKALKNHSAWSTMDDAQGLAGKTKCI